MQQLVAEGDRVAGLATYSGTQTVAALCLAAKPSMAQSADSKEEVEQLLGDFVRGWREGDAELLSRVLALDEGRITWVSGQDREESVASMTFRAVLEPNRKHPSYGSDGWEIVSLDVVSDELAVAKLRIPEGDVVNIDYLVCYRVAGEWRIVSNTFVIQKN